MVGVRSGRVTDGQNMAKTTIVEANEETGIMTTRPAAESIPMGICVPSNESVLASKPDDVISLNDAMLGSALMLAAQNEQSQAIDTVESEPMDAVNDIATMATANEMMPPDATEPEFGDLADINIMNACITDMQNGQSSLNKRIQVDRKAVEKGSKQRQKIKIADATTADGSANKRRKTRLRTVSAMIPQSASGKK